MVVGQGKTMGSPEVSVVGGRQTRSGTLLEFSHSQNALVFRDAAAEQVLDDLALHEGLLDDALDVAWLDTAVPNPHPSEGVVAVPEGAG